MKSLKQIYNEENDKFYTEIVYKGNTFNSPIGVLIQLYNN